MSQLAFIRPEMLWGLLAASLPVIIHLINRHRARKHPFAAIDFLLRVQRRSARRILLRQILLLAARTLLIAALVVAAAGPILRPRKAAGSRGPRTTAVILDRSFSMQSSPGDRTWFESAVQRARELVRGMAQGDKLCLLAAGTTEEVLVEPCTESRGTLLDALEKVEPGWGSSDLTAAMERAAGILAGGQNPNQRILLLTDGCAHAFQGAPSFPTDQPLPEIVVEDVTGGTPRDNHAVVQVEQTTRGSYLEVTSRFASYSPSNQENLAAEILIDGQALARGFVDLPAKETVSKLFNIPAPQKPTALGSIRLAPDALPQDDSRTFFVAGFRTVNALLVDGDMRPVLHQDELFYLEHALAPTREGTSGISFTTITPERFRADLLDRVEVVFLANVRDLPPDTSAALRRFVAGGGGLFVASGDQIEVERLNASLSDLLPRPLRDLVSLGPADPDGVRRRGIPFSDIDVTHPVLSIFKGDELAGLRAVRTWRAAVVEPGQGNSSSRVLLRYANGSPALMESRYHSGRVLFFSATLDRDWTSWPARASFLPFLQRATSYLAGRLNQFPPLEINVGKSVRIPLNAEADGLKVTRPDGVEQTLGPGSISGGTAVFSDTELPGWYQVSQTHDSHPLQKSSVPGLIVHLPPAESNLRAIEPDQLQALVGENTLLTLTGPGNDSTHSRSTLFLMLALALALTEAFLVRR